MAAEFLESISVINAAIIMIAVGFLLYLYWRWRYRQVEVISRDNLVLRSKTLGLSGKPDRLIRLGTAAVIPREKKSSKHLQDSHRVQVGTYLLLIEEEYGQRPPYGIVVLGTGEEIKVRNTRALRSWIMKVAGEVRQLREGADLQFQVRPEPHKCRRCAQRENCSIRAA